MTASDVGISDRIPMLDGGRTYGFGHPEDVVAARFPERSVWEGAESVEERNWTYVHVVGEMKVHPVWPDPRRLGHTAEPLRTAVHPLRVKGFVDVRAFDRVLCVHGCDRCRMSARVRKGCALAENDDGVNGSIGPDANP